MSNSKKLAVSDLMQHLGVSEVESAEAMAAKETVAPLFPALGYTECDPSLVLLRRHATRGQIHPSNLRKMCDEDLEYLAGCTQPLGLATDEAERIQELKVVENAIRATRELERRYQHRTQMLAQALVLVGTVLAALLTAALAASLG